MGQQYSGTVDLNQLLPWIQLYRQQQNEDSLGEMLKQYASLDIPKYDKAKEQAVLHNNSGDINLTDPGNGVGIMPPSQQTMPDEAYKQRLGILADYASQMPMDAQTRLGMAKLTDKNENAALKQYEGLKTQQGYSDTMQHGYDMLPKYIEWAKANNVVPTPSDFFSRVPGLTNLPKDQYDKFNDNIAKDTQINRYSIGGKRIKVRENTPAKNVSEYSGDMAEIAGDMGVDPLSVYQSAVPGTQKIFENTPTGQETVVIKTPDGGLKKVVLERYAAGNVKELGSHDYSPPQATPLRKGEWNNSTTLLYKNMTQAERDYDNYNQGYEISSWSYDGEGNAIPGEKRSITKDPKVLELKRERANEARRNFQYASGWKTKAPSPDSTPSTSAPTKGAVSVVRDANGNLVIKR